MPTAQEVPETRVSPRAAGEGVLQMHGPARLGRVFRESTRETQMQPPRPEAAREFAPGAWAEPCASAERPSWEADPHVARLHALP
eukprot:620245-Alexandrium_andersonii.AAC.1